MILPPVATAHNQALYSVDELDIVLGGIKVTKSAVHGPLAGVRSKNVASRQFLLALMNPGRVAGITSCHAIGV